MDICDLYWLTLVFLLSFLKLKTCKYIIYHFNNGCYNILTIFARQLFRAGITRLQSCHMDVELEEFVVSWCCCVAAYGGLGWGWGHIKKKSVALQLRRAKTDWSSCCQMTIQGALWLAKHLSLNLNFSFLNRIRYSSYQVATQLSSRGWVDPIPDPILPEKFLGYSRESNPGPLGWQSDVLTTIPNRWSEDT